jgi:3-oxoacyl-[acyl-carrier-protein] synthase-1
MNSAHSVRRTPCALAALGITTALGSSRDENWAGIVRGDRSRLRTRGDLIFGEERLFGQVLEDLPPIPSSIARYDCRNNQLSLATYEQIRDAVASTIARFGAGRVGIVGGTSTSGVAAAETAVREKFFSGRLTPSFDLIQLEQGGVSEFLRAISGATGPCYTLSTACSTGAKALAMARALLDLGVCDAVLAGATDSLCQLTANGFHSLQVISTGASNPMSRNRDGITLGEGSALFLLTRDPGGIQLLGVGESSDAHHVSAPDPTGAGAESCMRDALRDAQLTVDSITYLNLHGTGTPQNDSMESVAVDRVFPDGIPCSSTKPLVGHTLGASGAIEAAFCWLLLAHQRDGEIETPPHRYDGERDPELPALDLTEEGRRVKREANSALMTNSFGFGGNNCALILGGETT